MIYLYPAMDKLQITVNLKISGRETQNSCHFILKEAGHL